MRAPQLECSDELVQECAAPLRERTVGPSRGLTVTEVLEVAREPMRTRTIHTAVEELVGEPVSWSSVKNCLAADVSGRSPRFERVGRGRYRMASDGRV